MAIEPEEILDTQPDIVLGSESSIYDIFPDAVPVQPIIITQAPLSPDDATIVDDSGETWTYDEEYGVQAFALSPITSSTGLKGILIDILGPYDSIVTEYRYQNTSSSAYSYVRQIDLDYPWLFSAALFIVLLFCIFQIGGRVLCKK